MSAVPYVSILVPCYNKGQYIEECLLSILSQTFANIEVVLIDDASTDDTFAILSRFALKDKRIKIFLNNENLGACASRALLIERCSGEFIYFIDADDIMVPNAIESMVYMIRRHKTDIVKGWAQTFIGERCFYQVVESRHPHTVNRTSFFECKYLWYHLGTLGQYLFRRSHFLPFLEQIKQLPFMADDTAINALILSSLGNNISLLNKPIFKIRRGVASLSARDMTLEDYRAISDNVLIAAKALSQDSYVLEFFLQAQMLRRFHNIKGLCSKFSFADAAPILTTFQEIYQSINIIKYRNDQLLIDIYPDCNIYPDILNLAILLRYSTPTHIYAFFRDKKDLSVKGVLYRINHAMTTLPTFASSKQPSKKEPRHSICIAHADRSECLQQLEKVTIASIQTPENLASEQTCLFARLKHRIIRLRRRDFNGDDWQFFQEELETNLELILASLNTRWLLSLAEGYADYGSPQEMANANTISLLVNLEKTVQTNRRIYRMHRSLKPILDNIQYHPFDNKETEELWDGVKIVCGNANEDYLFNLFGRLRKQFQSTKTLAKIFRTVLDRMFTNQESTLNLIDNYILKFDLRRDILDLLDNQGPERAIREENILSYMNAENRRLKAILQENGVGF